MSDLLMLDVDGVVADFTGHLLLSVGGRLQLEDITNYNVFEFLSREEREESFRILRDPDWWRAMPPIGGAIEGVAALRADGWRIGWVTRPWHDCEAWASARVAWLSRHFRATWDDVQVGGRRDILRCAALIDDRPENVEAYMLAQRGVSDPGVAIVLDQPYNRATLAQHIRARWSGRLGLERLDAPTECLRRPGAETAR
jgi:5'(3')-deoxyribonucleotidase